MDSFLSKFFPDVIEGRKNAKVDAGAELQLTNVVS